MGNKKRMRKGMAALLSGVLTLGITAGALPGNIEKVYAATAGEPSVSAYATKTQLMDDTFAPDADGNAANIGRLAFGKNDTGQTQKWYILGKDNGVSGDNTVIFAASTFMDGYKFNSNEDDKTYQAGFGTYTDGSPESVLASHYGASDLRAELLEAVSDSNLSYFSAAEKSLMNETAIKTIDAKSMTYYTTSDKLYALQAGLDEKGNVFGEYPNIKYIIYAGSDDSKVLSSSSYWSDGGWEFWLRTPEIRQITWLDAWYAVVRGGLGVDFVNWYDIAIRPASNLNLTNTLFASAVEVPDFDSDDAVGNLLSDDAMTLRLDGKDKNIGKVTYDVDKGIIKAKKGSTSAQVLLVVQGKEGDTDWYYAKKVTDTTEVSVSDIVNEFASEVDLSKCRIWLETTEADGLTYAVEAMDVRDIVENVSAAAASGTYTENQTITLTSPTEGADIYYTTDGTEPSKTNGRQYTVPLSITGKEGQSVTTTIKAIAVKDGMYDSEVSTYTYTIELPQPGKVEKKNIDSLTLNSDIAGLSQNLLTAQEQELVKKGANALVYASLSANVSQADLEKVNAALGSLTLGKAYDISLWVQVGDSAARQVTSTNEKVSLSLKVEDSLINKDSNIKRTYKVIRIHDGVATVIDGSFDAATQMFTFETDKFSTYALAYSDESVKAVEPTANPSSPKTGDTSPSLWIFAIIIIAGVGIVGYGLRRRQKNV